MRYMNPIIIVIIIIGRTSASFWRAALTVNVYSCVDYFVWSLTEAQYASYLNVPIIPLKYECGFKPRSWLGIIIGPLLYYDVHSSESLMQSLPKIKEAVDSHRKTGGSLPRGKPYLHVCIDLKCI